MAFKIHEEKVLCLILKSSKVVFIANHSQVKLRLEILKGGEYIFKAFLSLRMKYYIKLY